MTGYLFVAEADRIQQFLYRSAHLREVVGASQLLDRFCQQAVLSVKGTTKSAAIEVFANGGKFQLVFTDRADARAFGQELAQLYWLVTDSTLTFVVDDRIVEYDLGGPDENLSTNDTGYRLAVERVEEKLRRCKQSGHSRVVSPAHGPHSVFCEACGTGLAEGIAQGVRLCRSCLNKTRERTESQLGLWESFSERVLRAFRSASRKPPTLRLPWRTGSVASGFGDAPDVLERYDPQHYVAYLVADGNNMGKVFHECRSPRQSKKLSATLPRIMLESLAAPIPDLIDRLAELPGDHSTVSTFWPIYPLYVGGDDVFALLPARYAVGFATRFCREFESRFTQELRDQGLAGGGGISAAVVICKSKYPYSIAHRRGEQLLREQAKHLVKTVGAGKQSSLAIGLIVGNELGGSGDTADSESRLRPLEAFWVDDNGGEDVDQQEVPTGVSAVSRYATVSVDRLFEARFDLRGLPQTRRAQLKQFLRRADPVDGRDELERGWRYLKARVGRNRELATSLDKNSAALGLGEEMPSIPMVRRGAENWWGHGLIDLLELWDYVFELDKSRSYYEVGSG